MKKVVLPLLLICLSSASLSAQEQETTTTATTDYDRWSIEVNGGINTAANPMTPGYDISSLNFFHADLGVRYMFNTKFGMKLDFGYDSFKESDDSAEFDTKFMRVALQGYANLGRIMEFETWTQRINLLGHAGVGVGQFTNDDAYNFDDKVGNFLLGLTAQFKITESVVLNGDFTMINNFSQDRTIDGFSANQSLGFDSTVYNASLGLTFYLGSAEKHADWVYDENADELAALEERIGSIETQMNDTDKDGVPDYLDAEPNSITGVMVDSKGRSIDSNGNGVPDELETYIDAKNAEVKNSVSSTGTDIVSLINGGYVNVYFDFNQDMPNEQSVSGINFLIKYLKENPSAKADVIGYADEIGDTTYNKDLSQRRAQNVKQILVDSGIDASRMNIVGNGEDTSVNKDSKQARQVVRRVTFVIK